MPWDLTSEIVWKYKALTQQRKEAEWRGPAEWEKIFASYRSHRELDARICKELWILNTINPNHSIPKWSNENEEKQTINRHLKKKCSTSLDMLHAWEPLWDSISPQSEWLSLGTHWITEAGEDVERGESLNTSSESLSYATTVQVSWRFLKKLKIELSYKLVLACDRLYTPTYMQWMGKGDYERGEEVWGDWNVIVIQTEKRTI